MDPRYVTDWEAIIDGLRRRGLTFSQLASATDIPRSSLERYRDGACPKHPEGERLLGFWCSFTLAHRDDAPVRPRMLNGNARK